MNLRKRKSTEEQVEIVIDNFEDIENTAPNFLTKEERDLNRKLRSSKRSKLEETKTAKSETTKLEDDNKDKNNCEDYGNDWEECDHKEDKFVDAYISERSCLSQKDHSEMSLCKTNKRDTRVHKS